MYQLLLKKRRRRRKRRRKRRRRASNSQGSKSWIEVRMLHSQGILSGNESRSSR
jgi:hypothetical protein